MSWNLYLTDFQYLLIFGYQPSKNFLSQNFIKYLHILSLMSIPTYYLIRLITSNPKTSCYLMKNEKKNFFLMYYNTLVVEIVNALFVEMVKIFSWDTFFSRFLGYLLFLNNFYFLNIIIIIFFFLRYRCRYIYVGLNLFFLYYFIKILNLWTLLDSI